MGEVRHLLFVMDSCYGGSLSMRSTLPHLDEKLSGYLEKAIKRKARQILSAGGSDQRVQDIGPNGHSIFTGAFLAAIDKGFGDLNNDGYITFYELLIYIKLPATRNNQSPGVGFLEGHELGEFLFKNPVSNPNSAKSNGSGVSKDSPKQYRASIDVEKLLADGKDAYSKQDIKTALLKFSQAAETGNAEALYLKGIILLNRDNQQNPASKDKALKLLIEAGEKGNIEAMQKLYSFYVKNMNTKDADYYEYRDASVYWLRKIRAQKNLAVLFS